MFPSAPFLRDRSVQLVTRVFVATRSFALLTVASLRTVTAICASVAADVAFMRDWTGDQNHVVLFVPKFATLSPPWFNRIRDRPATA